jgi:hypothetical protein
VVEAAEVKKADRIPKSEIRIINQKIKYFWLIFAWKKI